MAINKRVIDEATGARNLRSLGGEVLSPVDALGVKNNRGRRAGRHSDFLGFGKT
jgi:hypothetical protein